MSTTSSAVTIRPKRGLYSILNQDLTYSTDIVAQATVEERHRDQVEMPSHPIQRGAAITDHMYKLPAEVTITYGWSNSKSSTSSASDASDSVEGINQIYARLQALQTSRSLFSVYTGKRVYSNMACADLVTVTDEKTENCLIVQMTAKEVILADVVTLSLAASVQTVASATASTIVTGSQSAIAVKAIASYTGSTN